jgi:hypothetical protein
MMNEKYVSPEIEVISVDNTDIITTSPAAAVEESPFISL